MSHLRRNCRLNRAKIGFSEVREFLAQSIRVDLGSRKSQASARFFRAALDLKIVGDITIAPTWVANETMPWSALRNEHVANCFECLA